MRTAPPSSPSPPPNDRHDAKGLGRNYLFADGHAAYHGVYQPFILNSWDHFYYR